MNAIAIFTTDGTKTISDLESETWWFLSIDPRLDPVSISVSASSCEF